MYQIKCDDYILYDPRDDELKVLNPQCNLEVNKVGGASFTMLPTHPFYGKLKKLKSVFQIRQDDFIIFRGRMTEDSQDFQNRFDVDLEGALAYANDSVIPPFDFPGDFAEAETAENVVAYFLGWILDQHNAQVETWQKLKLGNVTVADPNNYITRSSTKYDTTWNTLKSKLFDSALGGYIVMRYEDDGNYVDYLADFELTNNQRIVLGENMRDITKKSVATDIYSAIFPQGADGLTLEGLADGDLTEDLVKQGKFIYSKSAREACGWKCVPPDESQWNSVTVVNNLKNKAVEYLTQNAMMLSDTITVKAVDLHFTDEEIQSFRIGRKVIVDSPVHGVTNAVYDLTKLNIDLLKPQGTTITVGATVKTMIDASNKQHSDTITRVESAESDIAENRTDVSIVKNQLLTQATQIMNDCEKIIMSALKEYEETTDLEGFKETVEAQFKLMADEIALNFTSATEQITNVNGDLQTVMTNLSKHFDFGIDGLTIKAGDGEMNLVLDNDIIKFIKNGQQFGWWDGVDFHTGNIYVEVNERARFGDFAFVPRSNGSLSFLKVGG